MDLRLIEQACGCSTVRGEGRLKVRYLRLIEQACGCSMVRGRGGLKVQCASLPVVDGDICTCCSFRK